MCIRDSVSYWIKLWRLVTELLRNEYQNLIRFSRMELVLYFNIGLYIIPRALLFFPYISFQLSTGCDDIYTPSLFSSSSIPSFSDSLLLVLPIYLLFLFVFSSCWSFNSTVFFLNTSVSVSYTHLDVYKRQVCECDIFSLPIQIPI